MKRRVVIIAGSVLTVAALSACTAGRSAPPSPKATHVAVVQDNTRIYAQGDLAPILASVNTSLGLGGTVFTQARQDLPLNALDPLLALPGTKITPSSCAAFLKTDGRNLIDFGALNFAALTSSHLNLIATAGEGTALPAGIKSAVTTNAGSTLAACKKVTAATTVDGQPEKISVTVTRITVMTNAGTAVGFRESAVIAGGAGGGTSTSSWTTLEVIDGNLALFVNGSGDQDGSTLTKAINAVIDAAKN